MFAPRATLRPDASGYALPWAILFDPVGVTWLLDYSNERLHVMFDVKIGSGLRFVR